MLFRSNDTATTEIYTVTNTLSLHDALPIFVPAGEEQTVAELGDEWKADNSHRARAARDLLRRLSSEGGE